MDKAVKLLELVKDGEQAKKTLKKRYERKMRGMIHKLYLGANKADREDAYQDAWVRVLKYLRKFKFSRDFIPWLNSIVRSAYLKHAAMKKKLPTSETGIATSGMIAARHVCRNRITTRTTNTIASPIVSMTASTDC